MTTSDGEEDAPVINLDEPGWSNMSPAVYMVIRGGVNCQPGRMPNCSEMPDTLFLRFSLFLQPVSVLHGSSLYPRFV